MKYSKLPFETQAVVSQAEFATVPDQLTPEQIGVLDSYSPEKLWWLAFACITGKEAGSAEMHLIHDEIFKPDIIAIRKDLADALAALLTDRHYVVIDQNPWASRLSIETPRPGNVKVSFDDETLSIHDAYGIWCSLIPYSLDLWKGEIVFVVRTLDKRDDDRDNRFLRTFRFLRSPSDVNWQIVEDNFYAAYGRIR